MSPRVFFAAWNFPPFVCSALVFFAVVYTVGFLRIRRSRPRIFKLWRWECFMGGLFALFVAVASPLDTFDDRLLLIHMIQHFVLMSIAPPLIIAGAPVVPLLRGLPRRFVRPVIGPLMRQRWLRGFFHELVRLRWAFLLMSLSYICWHIPTAYEATLANENVHDFEHACFFFTNVLFWWPIISPWPSRFHGSRWRLIPYLLMADIVNTAVAAPLVFFGRVIYPSYATRSPMFNISPLADQAAAGTFMWVMGSMMYLVTGIAITYTLLSGPRRLSGRYRRPTPVPSPVSATSADKVHVQ